MISYSKKCNMFSKTSALLLLLFFNFSSQLPDCKDVTFYYCPYRDKSSDLKNAITSIQPGYYIGVPENRFAGFYSKNIKDPDRVATRVMCSNYKDAWSWKKMSTGWDSSMDIARSFRINTDGDPTRVFFQRKRAEKQNVVGVTDLNRYLEMNCRITTFDSGPKESNAFMRHWTEYTVGTIPKNAFNAGQDFKQNPYYIGLVKYLGKTYIAKIMANVVWINIVLDNGQEISITPARKVLIMISNNADEFTWERVKNFNSNLYNTGSIFRCKGTYSLMFTSNLNLCKGLVTFKLFQESDRRFFDG